MTGAVGASLLAMVAGLPKTRTGTPAERAALDRADVAGSLEPGKSFDAVLIDGPATSLLRVNAPVIRAVVKGGGLAWGNWGTGELGNR